MSWTDDRVSLLKKLWGEGKSAAEIAKALGGGVTRNAVIGKAHRLKLSNRLSPIQQNRRISSASSPRPPREPSHISRVAPAQNNRKIIEADIKIIGVKMLDLKERMCRWPVGDPKDADFKFCGCEGVAGLPYCPGHARLAYQINTRSRPLDVKGVDSGTPVVYDADDIKTAV